VAFAVVICFRRCVAYAVQILVDFVEAAEHLIEGMVFHEQNDYVANRVVLRRGLLLCRFAELDVVHVHRSSRKYARLNLSCVSLQT